MLSSGVMILDGASGAITFANKEMLSITQTTGTDNERLIEGIKHFIKHEE